MNTTFDILVIVLSVLLGIFLVVSIIVTVLTIKLVKSIRQIVAKGEHVIDSAESAADMFRKAGGSVSAFRTIASIIETVTKHKK